MDSEAPNPGVLGAILTIIGVVIGWAAGALKAVWALSKFESRVISLEEFRASLEDEGMPERLHLVEGLTTKLEGVPERLHVMEGIAHKLEGVPSMLQDLGKTVGAIDKIIFQERGGLNIITVQEHEKMQAHCRDMIGKDFEHIGLMFKKDLEHIGTMVEQIVKHTGADELKRISESISNMERALVENGIMHKREN